MRSIRLLPLLFALVPAIGCGDDIQFPDQTELPDPAVNGVFPQAGFSGRSLRIQVSGDATEFTDAATVAFSGNGITVDEVTVASESLLFVDVTIAADADLSLRDVTITDGAATYTIAGSFEVKNALLVLPDSSLSQGGVGFIRIINLDIENPFLGAPIDFAVDAGPSLQVVVQEVTLNEATALVFIDTDAAPAPLTIEDGLTGIQSRTDNVPIQARTATALQPVGKGSGLEATAVLQDLTLLFSFTAESALTVAEGVNNDFANAPPLVVLLPGGKWANSRGFTELTLFPTLANETMFAVVLDPDFILNDEYTLFVDALEPFTSVTNLAQVEPNDTIATAQTGAAETLYTGTLASVTDKDFIKVTLTAGQSIRVFTTSGVSGAADTDIDIQDSAGLVIDGSGDSDFIELGEFVETVGLPAGDYFVVLQSSTFAAPQNTPYEASVVIVDAPL